jgi:hypothetical protein
MTDLTNPKLICFKGATFLFAGLLAMAEFLIEYPQWRTAALLIVMIWCFCRFYYFVFYVIERYVDPTYRFSGLWSFTKFVLSRRTH